MQYFLFVLITGMAVTGIMLYYAFVQERKTRCLSQAIGKCSTHEALEKTADKVVETITGKEFLKRLHGEIIIQQAYINMEEAK